MMIAARHVPSYVQGYRFSDDPYFYDADRKAFKDLAGYGPRTDLTINIGDPIFEVSGGHRSLKLNNTFHGQAHMPIPWHGSVVIVCKPTYLSGGTVGNYPLLFGDALLASSNGALTLGHFSDLRRLSVTSGGISAEITDAMNNDNMRVVGFALDQETRRAYSSRDGITVSEGAEVTDAAISGVKCDYGASRYGFRFGNLTGTAGDTTEVTNLFMHIHELHFFADNIWTKHQAEAAAMMGSLNRLYGA